MDAYAHAYGCTNTHTCLHAQTYYTLQRSTDRHAIDACMHVYTHKHAHTTDRHTHTHANTHTRTYTHTRAYAHTYAHTHTCCII